MSDDMMRAKRNAAAMRQPEDRGTKKASPQIPRPCAHHKPSRLGYIQWQYWAELRIAKGDEQAECPECKYWFFPDEMGTKESE
jgi:hypothetical protein